MKVGIIDVGTNSCRMLVVDYRQGRYQELKKGLITTRLGEGVDQTGLLKKEAIKRTLQAIKVFHQEMNRLGVIEVKMVGTSALRDVSNAEDLIEKVRIETNYRLEVISGLEEAHLIYAGASFDLIGDDFLIIDIGGGSTEFIWQEAAGLRFESLNMGAVRMTEKYILDPVLPITDDELVNIKKAVRRLLDQKLGKNIITSRAIGLGGTITTLSAMDLGLIKYDSKKVHQYKLLNERVGELIDELRTKPIGERKKLAGLQASRADIIIAGAIILQVIMKTFHLQDILVSEHDLLYGMIQKNA